MNLNDEKDNLNTTPELIDFGSQEPVKPVNSDLSSSNDLEANSILDQNVIGSQYKEQFAQVETEKTLSEPIKNINEGSTNKKRKVKKGPVIFGLIIVILLVLFGIYKFILNSPKNVFLSVINSQFSELSKSYNTMIESTNGVFKKDSIVESSSILDFDIKVMDNLLSEEENKIIEELNKLNLIVDTQYDIKNKLLYYGMDLTHNQSSMLNFDVYGMPNSLYVELKNIFDKYIEVPFEEYELLFEDQTDNVEALEYIINFTKNSVLNNLNKNDFKETKEKITIDSEEINTKKITYTLTEQKLITLLNNVLKDMKEDSKFIENLVSITGETKENIKDTLESLIDENQTSDSEDTLEFSVYTKGLLNELVQISIKDGESTVEMRYTCNNGKKEISLLSLNNVILSLVNEKEKENNYRTVLTASTLKLVVLSTNENENWTHEYVFTENESELEISGTLSSTLEESNEVYNNKIVLDVTMAIGEVKDIFNIEMTIDNVSKQIEKITIPEISNSILYDDITEEQYNTISTNLLKNETLVNFITKISSYLYTTDLENEYY